MLAKKKECNKDCKMKLSEMVAQFREAGKIDRKTVPQEEATRVRMMNLFIEEFEEFFGAAGFGFNEEGDPILKKPCVPEKMFHEMVDMVYILLDWALIYGWDFESGFQRVHLANMSKVHPSEGIKVNAAGKITKPNDFKPAQLNNLVGDEE